MAIIKAKTGKVIGHDRKNEKISDKRQKCYLFGQCCDFVPMIVPYNEVC